MLKKITYILVCLVLIVSCQDNDSSKNRKGKAGDFIGIEGLSWGMSLDETEAVYLKALMEESTKIDNGEGFVSIFTHCPMGEALMNCNLSFDKGSLVSIMMNLNSDSYATQMALSTKSYLIGMHGKPVSDMGLPDMKGGYVAEWEEDGTYITMTFVGGNGVISVAYQSVDYVSGEE